MISKLLLVKVGNLLHEKGLGEYPVFCRIFSFLTKLRIPYFLTKLAYGDVIEIDGVKMICTHDNFPSFLHIYRGINNIKHEEPAFSCFKSLLKKGMVVVEAGAGTGWFTLKACKELGAEGKVYAFETDKKAFLTLQKNIELNGFKNANIFYLEINDKNKLGSFVGFADIIVIDVEGKELEALKGADKLLSGNSKIICEIHPQVLSTKDHREIYNLLATHGFTICFAEMWGEKWEKVKDVKEVLKYDKIYYIFATKEDVPLN